MEGQASRTHGVLELFRCCVDVWKPVVSERNNEAVKRRVTLRLKIQHRRLQRLLEHVVGSLAQRGRCRQNDDIASGGAQKNDHRRKPVCICVRERNHRHSCPDGALLREHRARARARNGGPRRDCLVREMLQRLEKIVLVVCHHEHLRSSADPLVVGL
eukprot:Amastigsp_a678055_43.p2 type:complete len:158 gc:universal Amastigsp_a678055_43:644-171(-)